MGCNGCLYEDDCHGQCNEANDWVELTEGERENDLEDLKEQMRILAIREIAKCQIPTTTFTINKDSLNFMNLTESESTEFEEGMECILKIRDKEIPVVVKNKRDLKNGDFSYVFTRCQ